MTTANDIVNDIFSAKYNSRPESKYGSTRSTLFGKFYERVLSRWLEESKECSLRRWPNKAVHKPRIYWSKISLDSFDFSAQEEVRRQIDKSKEGRNYCTPDGVFEKNTRFYLWEAKNWPLYPEKGPKTQIWNYLITNPWVFSKKFELGGHEEEISGFWFSYWWIEEHDKKKIEKMVNSIIGEGKFEIICTKEILRDCIVNQYNWYIEIIKQEKANVDSFFKQLLGEK